MPGCFGLAIRGDDDRRFIILAAVMLVRQLAPADAVEQSIESVISKQPNKPAAWFRKCLVNQCRSHDVDFHRLEREAPLPEFARKEPSR